MHLQDRSVSVGRRQPSLLAREEWPLAVRGRRSAEPLQAKAGPVPDQPKREAVLGALRRQQRTTRMIGCRLIGMINGGIWGPPLNVACRTPLQGPVHNPTAATNMDTVLADMNRRGGVGAGFTLPEA